MLIYLIFLLVLLGLVKGVFLLIKDNEDMLGYIISIICGGCLLGLLISIPTMRCDYRSNIINYYQTQKTIEVIRQSGSSIERANLAPIIIEMNNKIARSKYWKKYFDIYIPKEMTQLEYLK